GGGGPGPLWHSTPANLGQAETWGYRPAPSARPMITTSQLITLSGTLPAISTGGGGNWQCQYPLLWGRQIYTVADNPSTAGTGQNYEIVSNHQYYTYGQDLTTSNVPGLSWNYKGQSHCVNCDPNTLQIMFAGLGVILNDGSTDHLYMVDGVYPDLGYFTVEQPIFG